MNKKFMILINDNIIMYMIFHFMFVGHRAGGGRKSDVGPVAPDTLVTPLSTSAHDIGHEIPQLSR